MYDRFFLNMTFICLNYTFWQNESPDLSIRQQTSKKAVVESLQRGQLWSSFLIIACRREKPTSTITVTQSGELCPWDVAAPFSHTTLCIVSVTIVSCPPALLLGRELPHYAPGSTRHLPPWEFHTVSTADNIVKLSRSYWHMHPSPKKYKAMQGSTVNL